MPQRSQARSAPRSIRDALRHECYRISERIRYPASHLLLFLGENGFPPTWNLERKTWNGFPAFGLSSTWNVKRGTWNAPSGGGGFLPACHLVLATYYCSSSTRKRPFPRSCLSHDQRSCADQADGHFPEESWPATGSCRLPVAGKLILRRHDAEGNIVETDFLLRRR